MSKSVPMQSICHHVAWYMEESALIFTVVGRLDIQLCSSLMSFGKWELMLLHSCMAPIPDTRDTLFMCPLHQHWDGQ